MRFFGWVAIVWYSLAAGLAAIAAPPEWLANSASTVVRLGELGYRYIWQDKIARYILIAATLMALLMALAAPSAGAEPLYRPMSITIPNHSFDAPQSLWQIYRANLPPGESTASPFLDCTFAYDGQCSTRIETFGLDGGLESSEGGGISEQFTLDCNPCDLEFSTWGVYSSTVKLQYGLAVGGNGAPKQTYTHTYSGTGSTGDWATIKSRFYFKGSPNFARVFFYTDQYGHDRGYRYIDDWLIGAVNP